jgi:hypothetical protein
MIVEGGSYFSGDVGIGTNNPKAKLDVNGSFRTKLGGNYQVRFERVNQINMYADS